MSIHINKKRKQYFICYKSYDEEKHRYITHTITNSSWTLDKGIKYMRSIEEVVVEEDKRKRKLHLKKSDEITLEELINDFKTSIISSYKKQTYYNRCHTIDKYIGKYFGLSKIVGNIFTFKNMEQYKADILQMGLSDGWVNKILTIMRMIITYASEKDVISYELERKLLIALKSIKETNAPSNKLCFWTNEEWEKFINSFEDTDRFKMLFRVDYECALRLGELLALKWEDFSFDKKTLSINKAQDNQGNITAPKNNSSNATVSVSLDLANALNQFFIDTAGDKDSYIFFADHHTSRTTIRRVMEEHIKLSNVPFIKFHGLRHSCASRMINAGCSPLIVSKHLRHSSTQQTLDTYSHLFPNATEGLMDKIF